MKLLSPLLILLSTTSYASPTLLKQGDPAPYAGLLFSKEDSLKIDNLRLDLDFANKKNTLLEQENVLLTTQISRSEQHVDTLSKTLTTSKSDGVWSQIGMFVLGGVVVGLVSYGVYSTR